MRKWTLLGMLALTTLFCGIPMVDPVITPDVASIVNATLTAVAAGVPAATDTSAPVQAGPSATPTLSTTPMSSFPTLGSITGTLGYPAEGIPALRIVAFPLDGSTASWTETAAGTTTYSLDLPVGTYHVVAYTLGGAGFPTGLAGGYTQAVPCGLSVSCTDHSLITVTITANTTISGVDPNDWYAPAGSFPPMPTP